MEKAQIINIPLYSLDTVAFNEKYWGEMEVQFLPFKAFCSAVLHIATKYKAQFSVMAYSQVGGYRIAA